MFVCVCRYEDDGDFREDDHDDTDIHDDGNDYSAADGHVGHDDVDQVLTCDLSTRTPLEMVGHQVQHKSTPAPRVIMGVVIIGEQTVINVISTTKITTNHIIMKVTTKAPGQE